MRCPNPASNPQLFPESIYGHLGLGENEESNERKLDDDATGAHHNDGNQTAI
jgi:hypothetical protein